MLPAETKSHFLSSSTEITYLLICGTPSLGVILDWGSVLSSALGIGLTLSSCSRLEDGGRSAFVPWTCSFLLKVKGGTSQHALRQKDKVFLVEIDSLLLFLRIHAG